MIVRADKLTKKQQKFAAEHHYVVDNFLRARRLSKDEYYDIVIFGFIRAVKKYFLRPELKQYAFSTIALWAMKSDLYNHYRKQGRKNRTANIVSLDSMAYDSGDMSLAETIAAPDTMTDYFDTEILWNRIASNLPDDCVDIIRMKYDGYNNREIAKTRCMPVKNIDSMMEQIRDMVGSMRILQ